MKSDWLEAFLAFSDTLNFTRAAEQLNISQPALHVKISKLAEFVGKPLYQKTGRNLVLTAEGQQLQAFARDQLELAQSFLQVLRKGSSEQEVCLSAGEGAFLYLLGNAVSSYIRRSSFKLRIRTGSQKKVIEDVLTGEAHMGVVLLDAEHENLACTPFAKVGQVLVMPASHPLASKRKCPSETNRPSRSGASCSFTCSVVSPSA